MAFKARLKMGGKEFDVISCNYTLTRDVDAKGRPAAGVGGGTINLSVESTDDTSIIEAMVNNQYKPLNGSVTFKKSTEDANMKVLEFETAYVIQFSEGFTASGKDPMLTNFTISAKKFKIGSAEHVNDWPAA